MTFLLKFLSLSSKSVFFTKLAISFLLAKFACFSLAVKFSDVNLSDPWVVIYLSWPWSIEVLFSVSLIFVLQSVFLSKLLTLGTLFSTAVRAVVVGKLVISGISLLISVILRLREALVAKLVMSEILPSIFFYLSIKYNFFNDIKFCYIT